VEISLTDFLKKQLGYSLLLGLILLGAMLLAISVGSSGLSLKKTLAALWSQDGDATIKAIVWQIRLPRVILAAVVGASLSLGGLVFQALLRNSLAEPYILGISGGAAVGAIAAMLLGLAIFPGVTLSAFAASIVTLGLVLLLPSSRNSSSRDSLLLGGVMVNAFCSALITFLISLSFL
jgi:iron complex transport system permease protein